MRHVVLLMFLFESAYGFQLGSAASVPSRTSPASMNIRPPSWNPFENLKQMADQRVARISHIMIAAGTDITIEQANSKFAEWQAEINNNDATFAAVAKRESDCKATASQGGECGIYARGKLGPELDNLIFQEDVKPIENGGTGGEVRGPIATRNICDNGQAGLSLIYVHTCWEPMSTGVVGALFDPPDSLKRKVNDAIGKKD